MDKNEIVKMEKNEIVSRLTPIFRDVFNNDALVVSEGMTAKDVRALKNAGELLELIKSKAA